MNCQSCFSSDVDVEGFCPFCGAQLSVEQELRLRATLPPPRTRAIEEDKLDMALRNADD